MCDGSVEFFLDFGFVCSNDFVCFGLGIGQCFVIGGFCVFGFLFEFFGGYKVIGDGVLMIVDDFVDLW